MPESKRHSYIKYDSKGFTPIDSKLPHWNPGNPNLHWGFEEVGGIDGKRYLHYPEANFYVNEDGTVRAFGQESIPIVNRRGKNYIEVMVPGADSTKTWWTGNDYYTVKNHYRIPIGETKLYIQPEPIDINSVSTKIPIVQSDLKSTVESNPKSTVKSDPIDRQKPVPVPKELREGLVKVIDGKTYYEFNGPNKLIREWMEELSRTEKDDETIYLDEDLASKSTTDARTSIVMDNKIVSKTKSFTQDTLNKIKKIFNKDSDAKPTLLSDKGVYLYKYPHNEVNLYQVSPQLARLIQERLHNIKQKPSAQSYIFSNVPLINLPNGLLNDTIINTIRPMYTDSTKLSVYRDRIGASRSVAKGYHTIDLDEVLIVPDYWKIYTNQEQDSVIRPIDPSNNLYFVRQPVGERMPVVIKASTDIAYPKNNSVTRTLRAEPMPLPTYPWNQTTDLLHDPQQDNSNTISKGVDAIRGFFKIKKSEEGGKINYLNYFNYGR